MPVYAFAITDEISHVSHIDNCSITYIARILRCNTIRSRKRAIIAAGGYGGYGSLVAVISISRQRPLGRATQEYSPGLNRASRKIVRRLSRENIV